MSLEDQLRSGRPSRSRTDDKITEIPELKMDDRGRTIDELADFTSVSWSSC